VLGGDLKTEFARHVAAPLGLETGLAYRPPTDAVVAATGHCAYRGRTLVGEVHDANAWHLGASALHAGLFGTAAAVGRLALHWLAAPQRGLAAIPAPVAAAMLAPPAAIRASARPLGWDRAGPGPSQAGRGIGANAFGHLGFTGTSVWVDPTRNAAAVLLTDRVAHDTDGARFRAWRPQLHDTVWAQWDAAGGLSAGDAGSPPTIVVD